MNALQNLLPVLPTSPSQGMVSAQGSLDNTIVNNELQDYFEPVPVFVLPLPTPPPLKSNELQPLSNLLAVVDGEQPERQLIAGSLLPIQLLLPPSSQNDPSADQQLSTTEVDETVPVQLKYNQKLKLEQQLKLDQQLVDYAKTVMPAEVDDNQKGRLLQDTADAGKLPVQFNQDQIDLASRQGTLIGADELNRKVVAALRREQLDQAVMDPDKDSRLAITKQIEPHKLMDMARLFDTGISQTNLQTDKPLFKLDVPIQNSSWVNNFITRINVMLNQRIHSAEIMLDPPELGKLDIRLAVDNESASIVIQAPNSMVKDTLEATMQRLRDLFADNGLELVQVNVETEGNHGQAGRQPVNYLQGQSVDNAQLSEIESSRSQRLEIKSTSLIDFFV